ncbi:MAG: hypothetical protein V5B30_16965 [Candidatus Accumulibacter delftensis]|jgi:hypothetical protein
MQHAEQGDQQPALPLAQYAGQALERRHERLPARHEPLMTLV